jgi:mannose-1-phosphate guanylyltransferase
LLKKNPNATVVVAPSDHLILNEAEFEKTLKNAMKFAEQGENLVTIGIKPSRPETGYGYIQIAETIEESKKKDICKVKTFTEKPNADMAKVFVNSGEFFWNSGIFVWTLQSIKSAFKAHLPEVSRLFESGENAYYTSNEPQFILDAYAECKAISIDYGVMEKSDNVHVICADFGWSDLGTWTSLYLQSEKDEKNNALLSSSIVLDNVSNSLVHTPSGKLVVLQDLDSYLVVDTNDVLMVCKKSNENELKQLINNVLLEKGAPMA